MRTSLSSSSSRGGDRDSANFKSLIKELKEKIQKFPLIPQDKDSIEPLLQNFEAAGSNFMKRHDKSLLTGVYVAWSSFKRVFQKFAKANYVDLVHIYLDFEITEFNKIMTEVIENIQTDSTEIQALMKDEPKRVQKLFKTSEKLPSLINDNVDDGFRDILSQAYQIFENFRSILLSQYKVLFEVTKISNFDTKAKASMATFYINNCCGLLLDPKTHKANKNSALFENYWIQGFHTPVWNALIEKAEKIIAKLFGDIYAVVNSGPPSVVSQKPYPVDTESSDTEDIPDKNEYLSNAKLDTISRQIRELRAVADTIEEEVSEANRKIDQNKLQQLTKQQLEEENKKLALESSQLNASYESLSGDKVRLQSVLNAALQRIKNDGGDFDFADEIAALQKERDNFAARGDYLEKQLQREMMHTSKLMAASDIESGVVPNDKTLDEVWNLYIAVVKENESRREKEKENMEEIIKLKQKIGETEQLEADRDEAYKQINKLTNELNATKITLNKIQSEIGLEKVLKMLGNIESYVKSDNTEELIQLREENKNLREKLSKAKDRIEKLRKEIENNLESDKEENKELTAKVNSLTAENAQLKSAYQNAKDNLKDYEKLKSNFQNLQDEARTLESQKSSIEGKLASSENMIKSLREELDKRNSQITALSAAANNEKLREMYEKERDDNKNLSQQVTDLKSKLSASEAIIKELQGNHGDLTSDNKEMRDTITQLKENLAQLKAELKKSNEELEKVKSENSKLNSQSKNAESNAQQIQDKLDKAEKESKKAKKDLENLVKDFQKLSEEAENLRKDKSENDKLKDETSAKNSQLEKLNKDITQIKEDMQKKDDKIKELKDKKRKLKEDNSRLVLQAQNLQRDVDLSNRNITDKSSNLQKLTQENSDLKAENISLQKDLDKLKAENERISENVAALQKDIDNKKKDNNDLKNENFSIKADYQKLKSEIDRTMKENEDQKNSLEKKSSKIKSLKQQVENLQKDQTTLKTSEVQRLQDELANAKQQNKQLNNDIEKLKTDSDAKEKSIKQLKDKNKQLKTDADAKEKQNSELIAEVKAKEAQIQELKNQQQKNDKQIKELKDECENLRNDKNRTQNEVTDRLNKKVEQLMSEKAELSNNVTKLKSEIEKLKAEIERLTAELDKQKNLNSKSKSFVNDYFNTVRKIESESFGLKKELDSRTSLRKKFNSLLTSREEIDTISKKYGQLQVLYNEHQEDKYVQYEGKEMEVSKIPQILEETKKAYEEKIDLFFKQTVLVVYNENVKLIEAVNYYKEAAAITNEERRESIKKMQEIIKENESLVNGEKPTDTKAKNESYQQKLVALEMERNAMLTELEKLESRLKINAKEKKAAIVERLDAVRNSMERQLKEAKACYDLKKIPDDPKAYVSSMKSEIVNDDEDEYSYDDYGYDE